MGNGIFFASETMMSVLGVVAIGRCGSAPMETEGENEPGRSAEEGPAVVEARAREGVNARSKQGLDTGDIGGLCLLVEVALGGEKISQTLEVLSVSEKR